MEQDDDKRINIFNLKYHTDEHNIHHEHNFFTYLDIEKYSNENKNSEKNFEENFIFYAKTALIGIIRGAIGLLWEHPLDSIKTQWQTNIHIVKSSEIVNYIYKQKGIIGFYRGFIPNLIRQSSKNLYRWPLMIYLPKYFKRFNDYFFKDSKINTETFCKTQTGFSIANIETFLISPLERFKVYIMTQNDKNNKNHSLLRNFYARSKGNLTKELFRGLEASLLKSNVSWISFLYLDHKTRAFLKSRRHVEKLDFIDILFDSIVVGVGNLTLSIYIQFIFSNNKNLKY